MGQSPRQGGIHQYMYLYLDYSNQSSSCIRTRTEIYPMYSNQICSKQFMFVEGAVASWSNPADLWCQEFSVDGVRTPGTVASQPG